MQSYFAFLAFDIANQRTIEAERAFLARSVAVGARQSPSILRRLSDAASGVRTIFMGAATTDGRLQTGRSR